MDTAIGAPRHARSDSGDDSDTSCSPDDGLVVPRSVQGLEQVRYVHNAFPDSFMEMLESVRLETPVTLASGNMYADRRFLRVPHLAGEVLRYLPKDLGFTHVLSDMRFIEYPPGGHILPHTDGVRRDDVTNKDSTTSMLLFTTDVPDGEGGETEFLESLGVEKTGGGVGGVGSVGSIGGDASNANHGEPTVLFAARPTRGSILLFPHHVPHRGACVGSHVKILLRGDLY
jgi:hypothetical protein